MATSMNDPKRLTDWYELDYFRRPRTLRRAYGWALGVVGLASLAWAGYSVLPRNHELHQAGPLSTAHAMFQADCQVCHQEAFRPVERLWRGDVRSVSDAACLQCHPGPAHSQKIAAENCASCHREHQGHDRLALVADQQCVRCHADLHVRYGKVEVGDVRAFTPSGHPPFRWWQEKADPGTVAFNHQLHLHPDGVYTLDEKQLKGQLKLGDPRTKRVLACQDCHQADEAGQYMRPIVYDQHCQSCHPLWTAITSRLPDEAKLREAAALFARKPAPHREPPVVRAVLRERLTNFALEFKGHLFKDLPKEELPTIVPLRPAPPPVGKAEWIWVNHQLADVEESLFNKAGGCRYCHNESKDQPRQPNGLPHYLLSSINERFFSDTIKTSSRWLPRSRFDHQAHRMLACSECHPAADSTQTRDVLLPTIETCFQCHQPRGGARSACVECHQFHGRVHETPWRLPKDHQKFQGKKTIGALQK